MSEAVICKACGWKGHREVPAEYWASVEQPDGELKPDWHPSDITSAIYGSCPECQEMLSWDWEVFWAQAQSAGVSADA
jgi:hypothetical protein